jgi:SAM-dependent methyltransferase
MAPHRGGAVYCLPECGTKGGRVDEGQIRAFYEDHPIAMPATSRSHGVREMHDQFVARVSTLRPARLLDAGCGRGYLGVELVPLCGAYYGGDLSMKALALARDLVPRGSFCQGSLCRLPYSDSSFDCVVCEEVLEHVPEWDRAVAELARVTRPGGRVLISMPNPLNPDVIYSFFVRGRYTRQPYEWPISRLRFERGAGRAGLRVEEFFSYYHRPPLGRGLPRALHNGLMRVQGLASRLSGVPLGLYQFFSLRKDGAA